VSGANLLSLFRPRPAAVVAPDRREPPESPDPLIAMLAAWESAMAEIEEADAAYADRLAQLPTPFRPGSDGLGGVSEFPDIDLTQPAFRSWNRAILGTRPSLQSIRLFNSWDDKLGRPQDGARKRREGRERVRLWIAAQRSQRHHRARLGLPEIYARRGMALDRAHGLEADILRTKARSVAGAAVKLKLWARMTLGDGPVLAEHMDGAERAIVSALGDLERMAGGAAL
jgi:hypothetical protein